MTRPASKELGTKTSTNEQDTLENQGGDGNVGKELGT